MSDDLWRRARRVSYELTRPVMTTQERIDHHVAEAQRLADTATEKAESNYHKEARSYGEASQAHSLAALATVFGQDQIATETEIVTRVPPPG